MRHTRHGAARRLASTFGIALAASLAAAFPPVAPTARAVPQDAAGAGHAAHGPRQRILLDDGWRFHRGDPEGDSAPYLYDVRPEVTVSADGKVADAMPEEAARVARAGTPVLKAWILPSGNAFIRDPARRHARPALAPAVDAPFARAAFDDSGWRAVTLPHDWAIEGPFLTTGPYGGMGRLQTWGPAWYRRKLDIAASDRGRKIFLDVDGAMAYASVWVNGHLAGGWPYGYNSFRIDLTPWLQPGGTNQLAIRLDNPPESARWYPGAGLYRNVWLTKTAPVHVGQWGVAVTTPEVTPAAARVAWQVALDNDGDVPASTTVTTELYGLDESGRIAGKPVATTQSGPATVAAGASVIVAGATTVARPRLWGPPPTQKPQRYALVATVRQDGRVVDRYETPFGIRTVRFDPDRGVVVNGEHIPLRGVNNHHDLGALGAAFNVRAAERQLEIMRAMGANALRMSHNPPDPQLLDLADRMGFLVMDEVFDSWQRKKTPLDFHLIFPDWHEQRRRDLAELPGHRHPHPARPVPDVPRRVSRQGDPAQRERLRAVQPRRIPVPRAGRAERGRAARRRRRSGHAPGQRLRIVRGGLRRLRGPRLRVAGPEPVHGRRIRLDRLRLPRRTDALLRSAQLVFRHRRPGRLPEGPLLPVPVALAGGPADGARAAPLDMAGACGPGHARARVYIGRRGRAVRQRQVAGPPEEGAVCLPPALGFRDLGAGRDPGRRLQGWQGMGARDGQDGRRPGRPAGPGRPYDAQRRRPRPGVRHGARRRRRRRTGPARARPRPLHRRGTGGTRRHRQRRRDELRIVPGAGTGGVQRTRPGHRADPGRRGRHDHGQGQRRRPARHRRDIGQPAAGRPGCGNPGISARNHFPNVNLRVGIFYIPGRVSVIFRMFFL
ncbi:MAG: hypothetical protein JF619_19165 [Massilia sp.]|nr:hypothetical protein [Massilia sp.]